MLNKLISLIIGYILITLLIILLIGCLLVSLLVKNKSDINKNTLIPQNLTHISNEEAKIIKLYQNEWEAVLETQRHFNNLTIKFRGFALTGFIFLTGAALTAEGIFMIGDIDSILMLITFFWIAAATLDIFYYHRLLIGAVEYAYEKFDQHEWLKLKGFFGLTTKVKQTVTPWQSQFIILVYYLVPIIAVWAFYLLSFTS